MCFFPFWAQVILRDSHSELKKGLLIAHMPQSPLLAAGSLVGAAPAPAAALQQIASPQASPAAALPNFAVPQALHLCHWLTRLSQIQQCQRIHSLRQEICI